MKKEQKSFKELLSEFKEQIEEWSGKYKETDLKFVYNENLDRLKNSEVKYILVGDNPGENELNQNKYFIGEAGLTAKWFFKSELKVTSFEDEVLILNKTPIYSKKTDELNIYYEEYLEVMKESQEYMCDLVYKLQKILDCEVIIVGFGNSRNGGKWNLNKQTKNKNKNLSFFYLKIKSLAETDHDFAENLFNFKHFSVMQFARDIVNKVDNIDSLNQGGILKIGRIYIKEILSSTL